MGAKILIVEDETAIRDMLAFSLRRADFEVAAVADATTAATLLNDGQPDLIVLDWLLPDVSGLEFARRLKKDGLLRDVPIIMLTARSEEDDKIRALESGVDDYVTKPFSPRELVSRIKAVLRRSAPLKLEEIVEIGGLCLDLAGHRVTANGEALDMGPTEFNLLRFFMTHPERVFNRNQMLDHVWGGGVYIEERTIDVHIRRLRKVLSAHGHDQFIQTVRGSGYRFSTRI